MLLDTISANTKTFFKKFEIVGSRTCEKCGNKVNIIKTVRGDKEETVSDCINCENMAIQQNLEKFIAETKGKEHEYLFNRFSIVPNDLLSASLDNYIPKHPTQEKALKWAKGYVQKFDQLDNIKSLLLRGHYGVGKSHLSKGIADELKQQGKTVIYVDVPGLLRQIKDTFGTNESAKDIYKAVEKADLVVFDDLGAENVRLDGKGDSWASSELFEIITSRTGKPNIFTTNCEPEELLKKYGSNGGRIVSRIMKGTESLRIEGKDQRLQN